LIVTKTPFRISFFGGGTDYPAWYRVNGGQVLATSIDKYCYITCRKLPPFFEHKHRIAYSIIERVNTISEIEHPAVRAVFDWAKVEDGLEVHHDGDLPARSGLGSSSTFTVGLLHALHALRGQMVSQEQLAKEAIDIEQNKLLENVGSQDQISAAYGGFNRITFHNDDSFDVEPLMISNERKKLLNSHLMLFFTGFSRIADSIAKSKIENFSNRKEELSNISKMVDLGIDMLTSSQASISDFGLLLDEAWSNKRALSNQVSNPQIDAIYSKAKAAGAIGGKILGAGGGGFMLLFVPLGQQASVRNALSDLVHVPFKFDNSGSRVVLYQPDGL
jgi:D-glycero-alpha-D-manno-heptose-7-phosphate kinase